GIAPRIFRRPEVIHVEKRRRPHRGNDDQGARRRQQPKRARRADGQPGRRHPADDRDRGGYVQLTSLLPAAGAAWRRWQEFWGGSEGGWALGSAPPARHTLRKSRG